MILLQLYLTFFKIGLFGFGGGYVMITIIEQEITGRGWLTKGEFLDLISIAQMTPGPIAINSATFVGFRTAEWFGAITATLGVISPSLILVILLARLMRRVGKAPLMLHVVQFLRPIIIGLIATAAWSVGVHSFPDLASILVGTGVLVLLLTTKLHPILLVAVSGVLGILLYGL